MIRSKAIWFSLLLLASYCVPSAVSQQVQLLLEDPGSNTMNGVYVGPYTFQEQTLPNGNTQQAGLICDDFSDEVGPGDSWKANVTSFSNLNSATGLMFEGKSNWQQGYVAMAYLATQMMGTTNSTTIGYLAYEIWAVFEPTAVTNWLNSHGGSNIVSMIMTGAANALAYVQANNLTAANFSGWEILTPASYPGCQQNQSCPQEYLQYVPEGGTALVYLLLALGSCFGVMFMRSRRQVSVLQ